MIEEDRREDLIKEGKNFINIRVVPFIRRYYPYLLTKIVVGLSGSCIYGEPDEKSDIDVDILLNDIEEIHLDYTKFEKELISLIEKEIYSHVDVGVLKLSSLGVNSFDADKILLSDRFLEGGFIIENLLPVYQISNWFNRLKILVREPLIDNSKKRFEEKFDKIIYYWTYSTIQYLTNVKPLLERGDFLTFDSFFSISIINLVKFIYLINNMFFPPTKWFFKNLKKAYFMGDIVLNDLEKINEAKNREDKGKLFEDLIIKIADIFNEKNDLYFKIKNDSKYFEEMAMSIALYLKNHILFNDSKTNREIRYKRVANHSFYFFEPKFNNSYNSHPGVEENISASYETMHFITYFNRLAKEGFLTDDAYAIYRQIRILEEERLGKEIEKEYKYIESIRRDLNEINLSLPVISRTLFTRFKNLVIKKVLTPSIVFSLAFIPFTYLSKTPSSNLSSISVIRYEVPLCNFSTKAFSPNNNLSYSLLSDKLPKVSILNPNWYTLKSQKLEALKENNLLFHRLITFPLDIFTTALLGIPNIIRVEEGQKVQKDKTSTRITRTTGKKFNLESLLLTEQKDFGIPQPEFPKVSNTNPSWYLLENQPETALTEERTDIRIRIGSIEASINNEVYKLDAAPYIKPPGRTMVPLRFIAEGLGARVGWDGKERKVIIEYKDNMIELWIGKTMARVNNENYLLDVAPEIRNGRTFVPIRFIAEAFGAKVGWNGKIKEVNIEEVIKKINEWSDADNDGLYFKEEKELGLNPNDPNTIYDSISDKELRELLKKYPGLNIFAKYPDGRTNLTLNQKLHFGIDPLNPHNFNELVMDDVAIAYTKYVWENFYKKTTTLTKDYVQIEMKNLGEVVYGEEIGKYLLKNLTFETIPIIDLTGEDLKKMSDLGLMEKLNITLTDEYVKKVIKFEDGVIYTAPILATFTDEFISENQDYINDIKKIKDLEFIKDMLDKYPGLTFKKQADLKREYPQLDFSQEKTFTNPDGKSGLSLEEKIKYQINPTNPNNFDEIINDKKAIEYAKTKGAQTKEEIQKVVKQIEENYGEKLGKALKTNLEEEIITPKELEQQGNTAKEQVKNMYEQRAYKKKPDGTTITLEDLTSIERYKTLIFLNKTFGTEDVNILLSQSPTLQKAIEQEGIQEFEDVINVMYKVTNLNEIGLNKKTKETNTFKKYINQLGLHEFNTGELVIRLWQDSTSQLKEEIKKHPKLFLAHVMAFSPWVNVGEVSIEDKKFNFQDEKVFNQLMDYCKKFFEYYIDLEKEFKSKGYVFDNEIKGFEDYDVLMLQEIPPISMDILKGFNNTFESTLKKEGINEALKQTFDLTEYMRRIKKIVEKYYHGVEEDAQTYDWLDPTVGPPQISYKISAWGIDVKDSNYGRPYGKITELLPYSEYYTNKLTPSQLAELIIQLLEPNNRKIEKLNQPSIVGLKKIVFGSLGYPLHSDIYKLEGKPNLFISFMHLTNRMVEYLKKVKKILEDTKINPGLLPLQIGQILFNDKKIDWEDINHSTANVPTYTLTPSILNPGLPWDYREVKGEVYTIKEKTGGKGYPLPYSILDPNPGTNQGIEGALNMDPNLEEAEVLKAKREEQLLTVLMQTRY